MRQANQRPTCSYAEHFHTTIMIIRGRPLSPATYRKRRQHCLTTIAAQHGQVPILLIGVPENDLSHQLQATVGKARQDPWFDWFCGCRESDAALLIDPKNGSTLYLEPGAPERVIWDGPRLQPSSTAKKHFGVDYCKPISDLKGDIEQAAHSAGGRIAMLHRDSEPGWQSHATEIWKRKLRGITVINVEADIVHHRMIKSQDELALHQQAIKKTRKGLLATLPKIPKMKWEYEIAGSLLQHYVGNGHDHLAFATIAGSGKNAATLHYPYNDQPLVKKGCVLIDSGASHEGYAADITRSIPQHGIYSNKRYRELYELVLASQALGIKHARPGITLKEWNDIAWAPIIDAGFTRHHGLGHHLGLDVHDPADRDRPLEPGMLITVEPGIYLPEEAIGIRIEDNIYITETGNVVTSKTIPKSIKQIESIMAN